jgi:uncharacterized membrane protein YgcG
MWRSLLLLLAAMAASIASPAAAAPAANESMKLSLQSFVGDNAGVLSAAFIEEVRARLTAIHKRGEVTVLVMTAPPLGNVESHRLAQAIGQMQKLTGKTNRDWVVFMLVPASREFGFAYSSSNKDATEALRNADEATRNRFIQELGTAFDAAVTPYFKASDWEGGLRAGVDALEGRLERDGAPPPLEGAPFGEDGAS